MSEAKKKSSEASSGQSAVVHKITPYPIEANVLRPNSPAPIKGSIVKLTEFGFLMRVAAEHFYSVGETQKIEFQIPASAHKIENNTLVMKTYDAMAYSVTEKLKMVEMHFVNLPSEHGKAIRKFLVNSGQVKPE